MTLGLVGWGMVRVAGTGVAPGAGVVLVSGMVLERGGRERGYGLVTAKRNQWYVRLCGQRTIRI